MEAGPLAQRSQTDLAHRPPDAVPLVPVWPKEGHNQSGFFGEW
jgi:hypothetical protein